MVSPAQNKFKIAYRNLNPEQKEAVDAIEGPVMVIAGPGTGKTHLLTMRIANILLKTDIPPEAILAMTFTESGVISMRKKLSEMIGSEAYRVNIVTFHGFANDLIKNYPDDFPDIIGSTNISDVDQVQIIRQIIDSLELKNLKPFGSRYFYLRSIINAINELKQQGILLEDFSGIVKEHEKVLTKIEDLYHTSGPHKGKMKGKYLDMQKHIERNKELVLIYADYQKALHSSGFYDYSDMIMQAMIVLKKNKNLLLTLQEQYLYILVDEHQDTNSAQNKILELLASYHKNPNLFIVGDEKQAIFRFQGASIENFMYFKNLYKKVKLITLKRNYRSTQTILDAAFSLNSQAGKLSAKAGHKELPINLYVLPTQDAEQHFLARDIKKLLGQKVPASEIAVLYRENRDVVPVARILEKAGVPFVIESDQDVLNDEDIRKLLIILKAVQNFGSPAELIEMLHVDIFGIPPIDIYKIASSRLNPYDVIKNGKIMDKLDVEKKNRLSEIYKKLSFWKSGAKNKGAVQAFEDVVRESGFLVYILNKPAAAEKLQKLHALFDQIKSLIENHKDYTLEHFFEYLDVVQEHNVLIRAKVFEQTPGRIRLMTAHKSKGLEFEYIYIIDAVDGHWGSRRNYEYIKLPRQVYSLLKKVEENLSGGSDEDERNLFYVALTRAKKQAFIFYARQNQAGREKLPSKFILEIKPELVKRVEVEELKAEVEKRKKMEFSAGSSTRSTSKEKAFLNQLFYQQGFSVTALNNYLECPWKYFYNNLLRIPGAPNKHLIFGTAVHDALKSFFGRFIKGENPGKEYLIKRFVESLNNQPIQENDYQEALNKGKAALSGYYDQYHKSWSRNMLSEFTIRGIDLGGGIIINGRLDNVILLDSSNNVNVIDYKTGRPKSRNEIEGLTKTSTGEYKRQLVFYNLLLNRYQNGKYNMVAGEINFVEPDGRGNYRKELFDVNLGEVVDLERQIKAVAKEILSLSFWDKTCDDSKCEYCKLRKMIK